jgi:hypothetical protein
MDEDFLLLFLQKKKMLTVFFLNATRASLQAGLPGASGAISPGTYRLPFPDRGA